MSGRLRIAALVALFVVASACSDGGDTDREKAEPKRTTTTEIATPPTLEWRITGVNANGTTPPSDDVVAAVTETLNSYLALAVVEPLHTGEPAADLTAVLTPAALERVTADPAARAALVDEGMPPATKKITTAFASAGLSSVAGPDGVTSVVAAHLDLKLRAVGPAVDVDILRQGEVVLTDEGAGWRIDSFQVRTQRDTRE